MKMLIQRLAVIIDFCSDDGAINLLAIPKITQVFAALLIETVQAADGLILSALASAIG